MGIYSDQVLNDGQKFNAGPPAFTVVKIKAGAFSRSTGRENLGKLKQARRVETAIV